MVVVKRILLTGATGGLGRMILPRLIEEGHIITCIARPKGKISAYERIAEIVPNMNNILVLEGDVRKPTCGVHIDTHALGRFFPDAILHAAADIRFDQSCAAEIYDTNCNGTANMLALATQLGVREVQHVSTVYVGGDADEFTEYDVDIGQTLRNPYEDSKLKGEILVRDWALKSRSSRRARMLRSSILIGCENGETTSFDAFYGYFARFHAIARSMRDRINAGGESPTGVTVLPDGTVDIPLVVVASPTSTLNMIPLNWYADTLVKLVSVPLAPRPERFHLVNHEPPRVRWVIETSLRALKISGVRIVETLEEQSRLISELPPLLRKLQKRVDAVLGQYLPYVTQEPRFASRKPQRLLGVRYRDPPLIDEAYLERLLDFAVKTNWGHATLKTSQELELA